MSVAWFGSWEFYPNYATRLFAAISLVEHGDATIDEFAPLTIDKAVFDGHVYLDKAPGMTLMALPAVAVVNALSGETSHHHAKAVTYGGFAGFLRLRQRAAVASGPAVLTALAAVLLFQWGTALTGQTGAGLFAGLGFALGTPAWAWSTTLFGHAPVAALFVIAAWSLWRATEEGSPWLALAGGAALGWAVVIEYQAVLAGSVIALWAAARAWRHPDRWHLLGLATLGGIVALTPLLGYNLLAFGEPLRVGYAGVVGFEGMQQGLFGLTQPKPRVLLELLFGDRRGLVWVAPVLIPAAFGMTMLGEDRRTRGIAAMSAGVIAVVLLVNAAYVYWDGGNSTGPRHAVPLIGLLSLGLAPFWAGLGRRGRIGASALLAFSIAINLVIACADVFSPPEFRWPLWRYVMQVRFLPGDLRTWPSEWLGWSTWQGLLLYCAAALPLAGLVVRAAGGRPGRVAPGSRGSS
jgi:4-amino-4-deoxy-L-arabinose transferase-like glycosyltransferase